MYCLSSLLDERQEHHITPKPLRTLSGHSLPITDFVCGSSLSSLSYCFTISMDRTCKVHDKI